MLTNERRNMILKKLYWKLWTSADFENIFQSDWRAVFNELQKGRDNELSDGIILMLNTWMNEQEEKET